MGASLPLRAVLWSSAYLALVTAVARASGHDLVLFPELASLTTVVIGIPGHAWSRSPLLLVITPALCGTAGIVLGNLLPYEPLTVALVVAISLLLIRALRSPVMPALSAGLLPLALGIQSWQYPLALVPGCLGLALVIRLRRSRREPAVPQDGRQPFLEDGHAGPSLPPLRHWLGPMGLFLAGALLLVQALGSPLVLYPPLLVLAWETLARPDHCPWRRQPWAVLLAMTTAAGAGLLALHMLGPQPQTTAALVLAVALLLNRLQLLCPPAFAVALLPFVVHHPSAGFPLHVLIGTGWLLLVNALIEAHRQRSGGREWIQ